MQGDQDKRRESRVSYSVRFTVEVSSCKDESLIGKFVDCEAIDFSPHGMQIASSTPLGSGSVLIVTVGIGKPTVTYRLLGEIRWARRQDGKAFMGVQLREEAGFDLAPWVVNFTQGVRD